MAFSVINPRPLVYYPVTSGQTVTAGCLVRLTSNAVRVAVTATTGIVGVAVTEVTGDGTLTVGVIPIDDSTLLRGPYAVATLPGAALQIATGGATLAALGNSDVVVQEYITADAVAIFRVAASLIESGGLAPAAHESTHRVGGSDPITGLPTAAETARIPTANQAAALAATSPAATAATPIVTGSSAPVAAAIGAWTADLVGAITNATGTPSGANPFQSTSGAAAAYAPIATAPSAGEKTALGNLGAITANQGAGIRASTITGALPPLQQNEVDARIPIVGDPLYQSIPGAAVAGNVAVFDASREAIDGGTALAALALDAAAAHKAVPAGAHSLAGLTGAGDLEDTTILTNTVMTAFDAAAKNQAALLTSGELGILDGANTNGKALTHSNASADLTAANFQELQRYLNRFTSAEQTGTAAPQNVAHGLGWTPTKSRVTITGCTGTGAGSDRIDPASISYTAANVVLTATVNTLFIVEAW